VSGLRALVVDDDAAAGRHLADLLAAAGVAPVERAASAVDALARLQEEAFDVVFLDVRLPGVDGLEALRVINRLRPAPPVVFVTAHADHAVDAFAEAAADYLLKPVTEARLAATLGRLRSRREPEQAGRLAIDLGDRMVLLQPEDIRYAAAQGDAANVATYDAVYPTRHTLGELERRLGTSRFARVHRSYLVNVDHVVEIHPLFKGTYMLHMDDRRRSRVPVSRREAARLRLIFGL
jgi:two-component system response regulator LytT